LTSLTFLFLFLPLFLLIYYLIPTRLKNALLLLFSLFFLFWLDGVMGSILIFSLLMNFYLGRLLILSPHRLMIVLAVSLNVLMLAFFKYHGILFRLWSEALALTGLSVRNAYASTSILIPLGISYYTFRAISYQVDVYRKKLPVERNLFRFSLYITFFPVLIAGPIVRYAELRNQIVSRQINSERAAEGVRRFIRGLALKVLIADTLAMISDRIYSIPFQALSTELAWIAIVAYTLRIFFDFSGYTDMAIGIGLMMGFKLPENFNFPYTAKNVRDFWRRWHMTLTSWLRDYIFLPIAYSVSRKLRSQTTAGIKSDHIIYIIAATVTFVICGAWHGSTRVFIMWGLYFAFFMVAEQLLLKRILNRLWKPLQHLYTMAVVMTGWIIFRSTELADIPRQLGRLVIYHEGTDALNRLASFFALTNETWTVMGLAVILSTTIPVSFTNRFLKPTLIPSFQNFLLRSGSVFFHILILFLSIIYLTNQSYQPFLYLRF